MATLLFLGASVSQLPAIRRAREAGHRVVAVDGDPAAVAFALADVAEAIDFTDVARVAAAGARLGVDGVLAISSDRAVHPAAAVAEALGLPGIGVDVARAMTDKALMRERLQAGGVPQPPYRVLSGSSDLQQALRGISLPAVLKPCDSGGQRGLFRIEHEDGAERLLEQALAFSRTGRAMLEQFMQGVELNGLVVVRDGEPTLVTLSDRLRPPGPGFGVGWIHSFPSALPGPTLERAREVAFAAVRVLGLVDGIAFPQLIADEKSGEVRIVEIAARIAAGQMADLVRLGTGIDLFEIAFRQALGRPVPDELVSARFERPIAIRFLTARPGVLPVGTVASIDGLDRVRRARGVLAADLYFDVGAEIGPLRVDADRRGYVVATAKTPEKALVRADRAATRLVVRSREAGQAARRRQRGLWTPVRAVPAVAVLLAVVGITLAFLVPGGSKFRTPLLAGVRIDKQFSPVCDCAHDVAHLTFRLLHAGNLTVQMVDRAGRPVTTFVHDRILARGWKHFVWKGRNADGRLLPDGSYRPEVTFNTTHRLLLLPDPVRIDTRGPRLVALAVRASGGRIVIRYTFDEPVRAVLTVDGRRAVSSRFAGRSGRLAWAGTFADGERARPGRHRVVVAGIDLAGNRSARGRTYAVRIDPSGL